MFTFRTQSLSWLLWFTALLLCTSAQADDIEIFYSEQAQSQESLAHANILFVLDTSGSMQRTDRTGVSRMARVKQALRVLINDLSGVNVSLMRTNIRQGGAVLLPMQNIDGSHPITGQSNRELFLETLDSIVPTYSTPTVDVLFEAARYFRGEPVLFGKRRGEGEVPDRIQGEGGREASRLSHPDSYTGGTVIRPAGCTTDNPGSLACQAEMIQGTAVYTSPIGDQCVNNNYIVLITDGRPTHNHSKESIASLIGKNCEAVDEDDRDDGKKKKGKKKKDKKKKDRAEPNRHATCGTDLLEYLYNEDQSPQAGVQNIVTHTIGLELDDDWLKALARAGGGTYHTVDSTRALSAAFSNIVGGIRASQMTFVTPAATVTNFNRLNHRNELYFTLFSPTEREIWPGNVKSFHLNNKGIIVDKNGEPAVDPSTGQFFSTATSFWSNNPDGGDVSEGGAAAQLPSPNTRKIYTYLTGSISQRLKHNDNAFSETNRLLTTQKLGVNTPIQRSSVIKWARGVDTEDDDDDGNRLETSKRLFDPLHSQANMVVYDQSSENFKGLIFYGDNGGFLRALDAETGVEQFAFIPEALLPNLNYLKSNPRGVKTVYGVDGPISVWVNDENKDGIIKRDDGDHAYVFFGLRRGGAHNLSAQPATDDEIESLLKSNPLNRYRFTYKGEQYYLQALGNEIAAYRQSLPGIPVDSDVQINSRHTVKGFAEIRGLRGLPGGQALYIGYTPKTATQAKRFSIYEGPSQLDSADAQGADPAALMARGTLLNRGAHGNVYALDVTDIDDPRILWTITGGEGDFAALGQTWSRMSKTTVRIGENIKEVLVFAGGYDTDQDNVTVRTEDDLGRAIFMVDAHTGNLLWSAGFGTEHDLILPKMRYSIPGDVKLIDIDGDRLLDQFYVADMGGQLWRFDVNNNQNTGIDINGGVIADIARDNSPQDNRRFYTSPDIIVSQAQGDYRLMLAIGSGYRAHPLNRIVEDRFYVFFSTDISTVPETYTTVTEADLFDATDNSLGELTGSALAEAQGQFRNQSGWFIRLTEPGEKVLSNATTVNGVTHFSTYVPHQRGAGAYCESPIAGSARLYSVRTHNATPVHRQLNPPPDEKLTAEDRYTDLATPGIPASPLAIKVASQSGNLIEEKIQLCVGLECRTTPDQPKVSPVYWRLLQ